MVLNEDAMVEKPHLLVECVQQFLDDPKQSAAMAKRFATFSKPDAAKDMAAMILAARK